MTIVFRSPSSAVVSRPPQPPLRLLLLLLTVGLSPSPAAAQSALARADDAALARAMHAAMAEPRNAAMQVTLAQASLKAGHLPQALASATRALQIDPARRDARLLVGDCLVRMGRYEEAIEQLEPADAEMPDDRAFAYVLGTAYIESDRGDDGRRLADRLVTAGTSAEAHVLIARARLRADDPASALAELKKAQAIDPRLPVVHTLMGLALLRTGHRTAALAAFRKELAIDPNDFDANLQIGEAFIRARQFEPARSSIRRAMEIRNHDVTARFAMARIYLASGQPDEARVMLEWVMKDDPSHAGASSLLDTLLRPVRGRP